MSLSQVIVSWAMQQGFPAWYVYLCYTSFTIFFTGIFISIYINKNRAYIDSFTVFCIDTFYTLNSLVGVYLFYTACYVFISPVLSSTMLFIVSAGLSYGQWLNDWEKNREFSESNKHWLFIFYFLVSFAISSIICYARYLTLG